MAAPSTETGFSPELAESLRKVLTADRDQLFYWLRDPNPVILRALLRNPRLNEDHLLALLQRSDLQEDLLKAIHRRAGTAASHRLKSALLKNPGLSPWMTQTLLPQIPLFELVNLCLLPGGSQDLKLAAERAIIMRLESVPLGTRITLARRSTAAIVGELLKEGEPRLMEPCLGNPRLQEVAILQFLCSHRAGPETISCIARHPRWKDRHKLRLAILKNPRTPDVWYTLFLPLLHQNDLQSLLAGERLTQRQKSLANRELARRLG
jgi:hypothetical protein